MLPEFKSHIGEKSRFAWPANVRHYVWSANPISNLVYAQSVNSQPIFAPQVAPLWQEVTPCLTVEGFDAMPGDMLWYSDMQWSKYL